MRIRKELGLTFDDVLLVPRHSRIASRSDVSTETTLVPGIRMNLPLLSANMDTVTESKMAIAMARAGGVGVIHRFMTADRQAGEVGLVKRSDSYVVEAPATIGPQASLIEAQTTMQNAGIGGLVVVDDGGCVLGLITYRDVLLAPEEVTEVRAVMTDRENLVVARKGISLDQARQILYEHRVEKLPLLDGRDRLKGLITAQDIVKIACYPEATRDEKGRLRVGAAVGSRPSDKDRAEACREAGADFLVVDIAHGHSVNCIEMVRHLKRSFPSVPVVAGNVATPEGVRDLVDAGADAVKVGVGAGSICVTRVVTGVGVPQLTAIMECARVAQERGVPLIADGGVRCSGDVVKALAAGADSVMIGSMLAGTEEAPGATVIREGRKYKVVRGMASLTANIDRRAVEQGAEPPSSEWEKVVPEGIEAIVPYRGSVTEILHQLLGGLRSGMSYAGAETIPQLWDRAEFIRITGAGMRESEPHNVIPIG